jgi:alanine racemase
MMTPSPTRPAWAACSRGRLGHNLGLLAGAVGGVDKVMAVLKAGAYGHGTVETARALQSRGVRRFGLATFDEAVELRRAGVRGQLLLLGALDTKHVREAARWKVALTSWSRGYLEDAAARLKGRESLDIHVKVDTGMRRLGFEPEDVPGVLADFQSRRWPRLRLAGAYTHLACADEPRDAFSARQLALFDALPWPAGLPLHAANSAAALRYRRARYDYVRSGLFLYGALEPELAPRARRQQPVLRAYASVLRVAPLKAGQGVSYGLTFRAKRPMRVATVCAGYADGMPRALGNRGQVRIQGRLCRILGRVCMDLFMADVSGLAEVHPGERVGLIEDLDGPCSARGWASLAGTSAYEILCGISGRLPRRWEA